MCLEGDNRLDGTHSIYKMAGYCFEFLMIRLLPGSQGSVQLETGLA